MALIPQSEHGQVRQARERCQITVNDLGLGASNPESLEIGQPFQRGDRLYFPSVRNGQDLQIFQRCQTIQRGYLAHLRQVQAAEGPEVFDTIQAFKAMTDRQRQPIEVSQFRDRREGPYATMCDFEVSKGL